MTIPVCLIFVAVFKLAAGAPALGPPPIFRNECKDPTLNDCPADTSTCYDLAYEYMCQCKSGFVDQSPDKKTRPGRVCVPADSAAANAVTGASAAASIPPSSASSSSAGPNSEESSPSAPSSPRPDEESSDNPDQPPSASGSLRHPDGKDGVPKEALEERARDDGNLTKTGRSLAAGGGGASGGDDLKDQFKSIDNNKNGKVDIGELRTALKGNGMKIPDDQIKNMLKAADANNDGNVNFDEFKALVKDQGGA